MMERSPFRIFGKVTFNEQVNILDMYCKSDLSYRFTKPGSLSKIEGPYRSNFVQCGMLFTHILVFKTKYKLPHLIFRYHIPSHSLR